MTQNDIEDGKTRKNAMFNLKIYTGEMLPGQRVM